MACWWRRWSWPISGRLINRLGERPLIVAGLTLQAMGMAWIALIATPEIGYGLLVAPLVVADLGPADQPTRRAAADRGGTHTPGDGHGLDRADRHARDRLWPAGGAVGRGRSRAG